MFQVSGFWAQGQVSAEGAVEVTKAAWVVPKAGPPKVPESKKLKNWGRPLGSLNISP